jgi:hypothetical protein
MKLATPPETVHTRCVVELNVTGEVEFEVAINVSMVPCV